MHLVAWLGHATSFLACTTHAPSCIAEGIRQQGGDLSKGMSRNCAHTFPEDHMQETRAVYKELFFVGSKSAGQTCLADEMQDGKCEVVMPVAFPDEGPRSLGLRGKFGVHPKQMQCRSASTVLLRKGGARRCQGRSRLLGALGSCL